MIEQGATVNAELTSDHYRSLLVKGGLEINTRSRQVTERYNALVEELYVELKEEEILGSFILSNFFRYLLNYYEFFNEIL